jgi:hypothetical protein
MVDPFHHQFYSDLGHLIKLLAETICNKRFDMQISILDGGNVRNVRKRV